MTADKAHWTAIATAVTSVLLSLAGVTQVDVEGFATDLGDALTLGAAVLIQAGVIWGTAFYKRNYLK